MHLKIKFLRLSWLGSSWQLARESELKTFNLTNLLYNLFFPYFSLRSYPFVVVASYIRSQLTFLMKTGSKAHMKFAFLISFVVHFSCPLANRIVWAMVFLLLLIY